MRTAQGKMKIDYRRWTAENKRWEKDHRKLLTTLKGFESLIRRHKKEIATFGKKAKGNAKVIGNGRLTPALQKKLKTTHQKQHQDHMLHARTHKNILGLAKRIQKTVRALH